MVVFFRSQDDVTKLVCHIYDIMLRLIDKPWSVCSSKLPHRVNVWYPFSNLVSLSVSHYSIAIYVLSSAHVLVVLVLVAPYILEVCVLLFVLSCFKFYPYGWEVNMSSLLYTLIIYPCFSLCKAR